jgi:hypothetical protein
MQVQIAAQTLLPTWELRWATKTATIAMFPMSCGAICPSILQPSGVQPNACFATPSGVVLEQAAECVLEVVLDHAIGRNLI